MAAGDGAQDPHVETATSSDDRELALKFGRMNLRALMDVVFGGAALALLLMWLVLAIAGAQWT